MGFRIGGPGQGPGQGFRPGRVDGGAVPGPEPGGLHQFGRHDPGGGALGDGRSGEDGEVGAPGALVLVLGALLGTFHGLGSGGTFEAGEVRGLGFMDDLHADTGQETGEHGAVDPLVVPGTYQGVGGLLGLGEVQDSLVRCLDGLRVPHLHVHSLAHLHQLLVEVVPLPHPHEADELLLASLAQGRVGGLLHLREEAVPDIQGGQEVARRVVIPGMEAIGFLPFLLGALARILEGEEGDDHQNRRQGVGRGVLARLENHPAQADVDGDPGQFPAQGGQSDLAPGPGHGLEFGQFVEAVGDRPCVRWVDEPETGYILGGLCHAYREHMENHRPQRSAQNLRIRESGSCIVVVFAVQADGNAIGHASTAPGPLVGGCLGNGFDGKPLHFGRLGIPADPGHARVHHIADAGYGQGGFGHIRGDDDALVVVLFEDPVLLLGRKPGEEGNQLYGIGALHIRSPGAEVAPQGGLVLADVALAGRKDQDVTWTVHMRGMDDQLGTCSGNGGGYVQVILVPATFLEESSGRETGHRPHKGGW